MGQPAFLFWESEFTFSRNLLVSDFRKNSNGDIRQHSRFSRRGRFHRIKVARVTQRKKIIQDKKMRGEWAEMQFMARAAEHGLPRQQALGRDEQL